MINQELDSQPQDDDDDAGEGGTETAQSKSGKTSSKKRGKARKSAGDTVFGDGAPLHSLTRRAVPIWTCSQHAVDVAEAIHHDVRLRAAKHALEAWNIQGLRHKASELMKGDFLHSNLLGVAQNCDKVKTQA
jgi:hypothetical protein